jgi:hypothetical protein
MPPLTDDDLAYMRETQAEHRPTEATLRGRTEVPDGMGGTTTGNGAEATVGVRLDGNSNEAPDALQALHGGDLVKVTMDLVPVFQGDTIELSATEAYEVVTNGDPDRWATAQVVWAVRTAFP